MSPLTSESPLNRPAPWWATLMGGLRFHAGYQEYRKLRSGVSVLLRLIRASDAPLLLHGFQRLSPESRYRRFLAYRRSLSPTEVEHFTRCDGVNHFALAAVTQRHGEIEEGIGTARFVRLAKEPVAADFALTVIDEYQGQGLGRLLLARLLRAAAERGVREFRSTVLAENKPILALARSFGAADEATNERGILEMVLPVTQAQPAACP